METSRARRVTGQRERALDAISLARREDLSLEEAARRKGTTVRSVLRHAGEAVEAHDGQYHVRPADHIPRRMTYLDEDGPRWVTVRDSRQASNLAEYHNDVKHYLWTGDAQRPLRWKGQVLETDEGPLPYLTDLDVIDDLALGSELEYEVYRRV
jgi:hypothetical protein